MSDVLNVAAIQLNPVFLDLEQNRKKIKSLVERTIANHNSELIVLPELTFSGYNFETIDQVKKSSEEIPTSKSCKLLEKLSIDNSVYIIAGINERSQDQFYNSAVVFGPNGFITKYRKLQLYAKEKEFFKSGDLPLQIFKLRKFNVGIMICFDWFFPEIPRSLSLRGADIICHVMNAVIPDGAYIGDTFHSKWNRVFIILANRIGNERDLVFVGNSIITNHEGKILKQASSNNEEIITSVINPLNARNKKINYYNDVFKDRRSEYYTL
ncbi:MAG: nitrilase-related carbon-nitrogen hydrolase [Candidatus Helarchaeota archaeon]